MRSRALTAQQPAHGRETLWYVLVSSAAVLALGLAAVTAGLAEPAAVRVARGYEPGECGRVARGMARALGAPEQRQPCMQPRSAALFEGAAIAGAAPTGQLHQQGLAGRGRVRLQPDTQSVIRLIRERQDAIIMAFTHRMRDASVPGSVSHSADRPPIVTRPLRGPPADA
jgi:hypothetical protein